jgi:hypothetical protein
MSLVVPSESNRLGTNQSCLKSVFLFYSSTDHHRISKKQDAAARILKSGWVPPNAAGECQHYRLNFNACSGRLDVPCFFLDVAEEER